MDKLDVAIAAFEDESSDLTLGERVSILRDALMWNAFNTLKRIKKHGTKSPISEDEEYKQIECMKHFREIEKMYTSTVKMNKLTGKSEDKMNDEFMQAVRNMKSTMGDIEQRLDANTNKDGQ